MVKPAWRRPGVVGALVAILPFLLAVPAPGFESRQSETPVSTPAKERAPKAKKATRPSKRAQPVVEESDGLPPAGVTLGARGGDGVAEGFGDVLVPVLMLKSGLVFLNPRAAMNDHDEEEYNLGLGYRHLLPDRRLILGANLYYDHRETELGSRFDQLGLGVEVLGAWADFRANYYLPDDSRETVDELDTETVTRSSDGWTEWGGIEATGHSILQNGTAYTRVTTVTTRQHFEQYEQAMEGYDLEFGVKLPIPVVDDYVDLKVFGGYYAFDANFGGDDVEGFKGRVEVRAVPSVYLDAEWYEDDRLSGSDYFVGARVNVPFDVANLSEGRNPFEGAAFLPGGREAPFASRLTEMVMRDLHVRTEVSPLTEVVAKRSTETKTETSEEPVRNVLVDNITFVDRDGAGATEDGTAEHPYDTVHEGAGDPRDLIYIRDAAAAYDGNVVVGSGVTLWGSGCPLPVGNTTYGSGIYPVIDGLDPGPTIGIAGDGVTIRGLEIRHSGPGGNVLCPVTGRDISRAGIAGCNVTDVEIACTRIEAVSDGIELAANSVEDFRARLDRVTVTGASEDGVYLYGRGASGTFGLEVSGDYSGNGGNGLCVIADNYDAIDMNFHDLAVNNNGDMGLWVMGYTASAGADTQVLIERIEANGNQGLSWGGTMGDGVCAELRASGLGADASLTLRDAVANGNTCRGAELNVYAMLSGQASLRVEGLEANGNREDGLYARVESHGDGAVARADLMDVTAGGNSNGVRLYRVYSPNGGASLVLDGIQANGNTGRGICIEPEGVTAGGNNQDAVLSMSRVQANGNGLEGIRLEQYGARAIGLGGDASFRVQDVEVSGNGESGMYVYWYPASAADGEAQASFDTVTADGNGGDGLHLDDEVAYSSGDASFEMTDVRANGNDDSGVYLFYSGANSWNGAADAVFLRVEASGNGDYGIYVDDHLARAGGAGAAALAEFSEVRANDNGLDGIHLDDAAARADAIGGTALLTLRDVDASGNGVDGLLVNNVFAPNAGADVVGERIRAVTNGNDGVQFLTTAAGYTYDFGGAGQSAGNSSIHGNGSRDFNNSGAGSISAENNWWGVAPPVAGQFQGAVDYTPWLTLDPLP